MRRAQLIGLAGIVVASGLWATPAAGQEVGTGMYLLQSCAEHMKTRGDRNWNATRDGYCTGIVSGVVDVSGMSDTPFYRRVCVPDSSTAGQWARVVYNWLEDHPERLHEYEHRLIIDAIREAFPCSP